LTDIEFRLEATKKALEEVRNCNCENCPYHMSEEDHEHEELILIGRKQALEEVNGND